MKSVSLVSMATVAMIAVSVFAQPPQAPPSSQKSPASPSSPQQSMSQQPSPQQSSPQQSMSQPSAAPATGGGANSGGAGTPATLKRQALPFAVYVEQGSKDNHYIPSGWMGDYGDIKINPGCTMSPHSGKNCFRVDYSGKMTNGAGWSGMFWQQPANNWGDKKGGYNLTGAKRLTFWARGAKGGEKISEFKFGGITGEYPDSDSNSFGPVELTNQWKQYSIDLTGKDLSAINGGFAWAASRDDNPNGFTIFLDDIVYQ